MSHIDAEVIQILPDKVPFKVVQLCVTNTWHKVDVAQQQQAGSIDGDCKPNVGELIVAYFKPDTCVGVSRVPAEGMVMRVYDPHFLRSTAALPGGAAVVFGYDSSVTCAMINTNCWEAIGDAFA